MIHTANKIGNITPEFLSMIRLPDESGKQLNYLIVVPILARDDDSQYYPFPVYTASVSAALKASGRNVYCLNLNYKGESEKLLRRTIVEYRIDVVIVGGFSGQFWLVKGILDIAKETRPSIIFIVGGAIITGDPVTAMTALENADYGMIGESDISVNALAYALETGGDQSKLEGIICHRDGGWLVNEKWPVISNLDILPFPDYEGLEYSKAFGKKCALHPHRRMSRSSYVPIFISRSCPFTCTFCSRPYGRKYREMSMDKIFELIDWLLVLYPNLEVISFSSSQMNGVGCQDVMEFSRRIKRYNLKWRITTHAAMLTEEKLAAMGESGCYYAEIGIESADNRILKSMQKNVTIEQINRLVDYAEGTDLYVRGGLIYGDVEETMETFWVSANWWLSRRDYALRETGISFQPIRLWPGTDLYKIACERGVIKDRVQFLKDGCPPVNVSKMSDDEYYTIPFILQYIMLRDKLEDVAVESQNDYTVNVTGRCPLCREQVQFLDLEYIFNVVPLPCPTCKQNISVNPIEYCDFGELNAATTALVQRKDAAVWAVNQHNFYWLFKAMPALKADNVTLINKSAITLHNHTIGTFEGKRIYTPDAIKQENIDTIIVPNNLKVFAEIKKQCAAEFPCVKRIVHITELLWGTPSPPFSSLPNYDSIPKVP